MSDENREPVKFEAPYYQFRCPYCKIQIEVHKDDLNCKIFRCGVYKKTGNPIPPHSKKVMCDELVKHDLIYGCAKPFIYKDEYIEPCDYIGS